MTKDNPKVAVIILNWNGREDTIECLNSLKKAAYGNREVVVVDNGSTDGSQAELKKRFPKVKLIENRENLGFAEGNNIGVRSVKADYYLLLNNDTVVNRNFIRELMKAGESSADIGVVGPKICFYDRKNVIWAAGGLMKKNYGTRHIGYNEEDKGQYDSQRDVDFVSGCALMVKKKTIRDIGLLDKEFFIYLEDVDYCLRAKEAGYRVLYAPNSLVWHKCSAGTRKTPEKAAFHTEKNILLLAGKHKLGLRFYAFDFLHLMKFIASCMLQLNYSGIKGALKAKLWYLRKKVL